MKAKFLQVLSERISFGEKKGLYQDLGQVERCSTSCKIKVPLQKTVLILYCKGKKKITFRPLSDQHRIKSKIVFLLWGSLAGVTKLSFIEPLALRIETESRKHHQMQEQIFQHPQQLGSLCSNTLSVENPRLLEAAYSTHTALSI